MLVKTVPQLYSTTLPNNIVMRRFVAETVLMDVNSGRYFRLDRDGGAMLDAMVSAPSVADAANTLSADGWGDEDTLHGDLRALAHELAAIGLLRLHVE